MTDTRRWRASALILAAITASSLMTTATLAAQPSGPQATNGLISYWDGFSTVFVAEPDGSNPRPLTSATRAPAWAPDGSRFAYAADGTIRTKRFDGTGEIVLTDGSGNSLAWSSDGSVIFFGDGNGRLKFVTADGAFTQGPLFNPGPSCADGNPTTAPNGTLVFDRACLGAGHSQLFQSVPGSPDPTLLVDDGFAPSFSVDGARLAYVRTNSSTGRSEVWTANADGSSQQLLVDNATSPSWSPDGATVLYASMGSFPHELRKIDAATGQVTELNLVGNAVSWQPVERNAVDRVFGPDNIGTAIAGSQYNFETRSAPDGRARASAVVLARDDSFAESLGGSAFAINRNAPLLVTGRTALDARVEREIQRTLGATGRVYLLGNDQGLTPAVADRLTALGYSVTRVFGTDRFDTAVKINRRMTSAPRIAVIADGTTYVDALSAGPAVGAIPNAVLVLSNGTTMPATSLAYLNGLNPDPDNGTQIVTVGDTGDRALTNAYLSGQLPSWPTNLTYFPIVGANQSDTSVKVAEAFFAAPITAGVNTTKRWFNALVGGAVTGFNGGPVLLTDPRAVDPVVTGYLTRNSGNIWWTTLVGDTSALPAALQPLTGDAISIPGQWDFFTITPQESPTSARTLGPVSADPATRTTPVRRMATGLAAEPRSIRR